MTQEALKLAEDYAHMRAIWYVESLYGTSASHTELREKVMLGAHQALKEALAQPEQEPVALQDDEIYDAAFSAYCKGENSRELFRTMWSSRLTCSIGWDRDELKSFARNIAALYIHPREKNQ